MTYEQRLIEKAANRHAAASHAMQSGVRWEMELDERDPTLTIEATPQSPKHLRVGINAALVDHASVVALLIEKGIISELEYTEAIARGMENEKEAYERRLSERLGGIQVTLK